MAFKDLALQVLGELLNFMFLRKNEKGIIIGATSGDTGSAALYSILNKESLYGVILYPKGNISAIQEMQMTTILHKNIITAAVNGSFDDCQSLVKNLLIDCSFRERYNLISVNSINWTRIAVQFVFLFRVFIDLIH